MTLTAELQTARLKCRLLLANDAAVLVATLDA